MAKPVKSNHIRILTALMLIVTAVAISVLLLAYLAFYINPELFPWLAIAGIAYPFILIILILIIVFWIFYRIKYAIIPLFFILIGWNHVGRLFTFQFKKTTDVSNNSGIQLISYNIQNFLKINTSTTRWVTDFENEKKITAFLTDQKPGIICLQEMLNDRTGSSSFAANLGKTLNCNYFYYQNYYPTKTKKIDALATFSRYPIIKSGSFTKDEKTYGLYTDLKISEDTIRVYNLHLASIHFQEEDYRFWSEMDLKQEQEKLKLGTLKIAGKMKLAYIKRAQQVLVLREHMRQSPYPVVVCGDFNDTPNSYTYRLLSEGKNDAHLEGGSGLGTTYAGKEFPAFRIDFILFDSKMKITNYKRHQLDFSDHYPISCQIQIHP